MSSKNRTCIPRSSPPKSSLTTPYSPTPHHNAPIPLRGTGKSASRLNPPFSAASGTDPLSSSLPKRPSCPLDANLSNSVSPQVQRINGSRLPAPIKVQGRIGFGLGFSPLPTSTSTSRLKTTPSETLPERTGRPSFHVPVIHSPASKFMSMDHSKPADFGAGIHSGSTPIGFTVTFPLVDAGESSHDVVLSTSPSLMRTPTTASNVSSASQYTVRSADSDGREKPNIVGEEHTADTTGNDIHCEDEDDVLSPGFDVIQDLADKNKFQNVTHATPYEQSSIPPRPRPFSPDISDVLQSIRTPLSPIASVVRHPAPSPPSPRVPKTHRRSLVVEAADMMLKNPPTQSLLRLHEAPVSQTSKSKTPPPRPPTHKSEDLYDIIQQVETLIGRPCVDRDAVDTAHREARARSDAGSSPRAVFGACLNITTRYASCSSVLGGQTHALPLVVFACVEELYRAGLRSSRLLRPPPHGPVTPSHTVSLPPANVHSATYSFPALVAAFNTPPTYGDDVDLALASLDDVGALLLTYLDCLPGGIVPVWMRGVLGDVVGIYEEGNGGLDSAREQQRAISAAKMVLRLLPAAHFSLLVYLLAFLSQIPLYEAQNGWNVRGVARAFARVVVGVGAGVAGGGVKGKGRDVSRDNGNDNIIHREEDVNWVAEEEDAVEVLEWLLASWDDLSDGLFFGPQREGQGKDDGAGEKDQGERGEKEMHRAAAMRQLDPPHNMTSDDSTTIATSNTTATNTSVNALLVRIASLESENARWKWLHGQHKAELQRMFQGGERRVAAAEEALMEERNSRARAEAALIKERVVLRSSQTSTEDAVRAERALWVGEVQALREACDRLKNVWEAVGKERDEVGNIVQGIVRRFVAGASKGSEGARK